jgi:hypothetical protein
LLTTRDALIAEGLGATVVAVPAKV